MKKLLILIVTVLIVLLLIYGNKSWDNMWSKFDFQECSFEVLTGELIKAHGIIFPESITEVNTAKGMIWDTAEDYFIIKFSATPEVVNEFVRVFPRPIELKEYKSSDDFRITGLNAPEWFLATIQHGKYSRISGYGGIEIYIDTSGDQFHVVYLQGYYGLDEN